MGLGGWVKNFSMGICDGAPSTAGSSSELHFFVVPDLHLNCLQDYQLITIVSDELTGFSQMGTSLVIF